jgi:hypothetical protein
MPEMENEWEEFGSETYWKPKLHDVLEGLYLSRVTESAFTEGQTQDVARVEDRDGVVWKVPITAGLRRFFDKHATPGDVIKLEYIGKSRSKKGNEFKAFRSWRKKANGDAAAVSARDDTTDYAETPF